MGVVDVIDVEEQDEPPTPSARKRKAPPPKGTLSPPPRKAPRTAGPVERAERTEPAAGGGGRGGRCTSGWSSSCCCSGRGLGRRARSARRPPTATLRPACPGPTRRGGTPSRRWRTSPRSGTAWPDYYSTCPSKAAAYCGALYSIRLADYTFPSYTKLFWKQNGKALGPTPWKEGTRVVLVDGSLDALPSEVDIARISAVGFRYGEDTDLMMPIWSPKSKNQSDDNAVSTILAQHLDKNFVSAQPSLATANDATRDLMCGRFQHDSWISYPMGESLDKQSKCSSSSSSSSSSFAHHHHS